MLNGGASAVKEPGHFEVRKSSSQVTRCTFFLKKVDDLLVVALKPRGRRRRFTVKIEQIKWSDMVTFFFIFCSHYYRSKAIRRARQGGAPPFFMLLPWCLADE